MNDVPRLGPTLPNLYALFPAAPGELIPEFEIVHDDEVPPPYRHLLVHEHHMTVTVESHHGDSVDVRILARMQTDGIYARKILLTLHDSGRVVQFGIMKINLTYCSPAVLKEIIAGQTPLGRILIEHNVLRRIEPTEFLRVIPDPAMMHWFGLTRPQRTYGRLAIIHCNEQPAVELLEIVAPEKDEDLRMKG
jgi:chorismate-pyruvate lyase